MRNSIGKHTCEAMQRHAANGKCHSYNQLHFIHASANQHSGTTVRNALHIVVLPEGYTGPLTS